MSKQQLASNNDEMTSLINTEQYDKLEDAWLGIVESDNKDLPALLDVVEQLARREERKRALDFLRLLVPRYKQNGLYHDVLTILKKILEYNLREKGLGASIAECFLNIYKERPYTNNVVEKAGLETASDIYGAIRKLERYFCYDCGDYVYHKSWGVGEVVSIDPDNEKVNINFENKFNHSIAMDFVHDILQKLDKNDLLVMIYARKDALNKMVDDDPVGLIKMALKYFKGKTLVSNMKKRLTDGVVPAEAWSKWWSKTKKLLKKDLYIKITDGTSTKALIELRSSPASHHDDILENINDAEDINKKIEIARKYIFDVKDIEIHKETLGEIGDAFTKEVDKLNEANPSRAIECLLLLEEMQCLLKDDSARYKERIESIINGNGNLPELVDKIDLLEYKKQTLRIIKKLKSERWAEEFASVFFSNSGNLWEFIIKEFIKWNERKALEGLAYKVFNQFNAYPEHYIWFCKNAMNSRNAELYENIDKAILFKRLIELHDNIYYKIQKGRDGNLKAIINKIAKLLEDGGVDFVKNVLNDANAESVYNVISSSKGLEDWFMIAVESEIQARFPDIFEEQGPLPKLDENKLYVTKEGYEKRKKEFDHLMNVEFGENARDLGEAISRGDLRENAEYKAAREKQAMLVEKAERMKAELQKAVVIEPHTVSEDVASPGTRVTLRHQGETELEVYTILGPWDVDIDKGVISYLSPVGKGLLNRSVGETVTIKLPEGESTYEIMKIEKAL
jgi:transcription elongation factor GreA